MTSLIGVNRHVFYSFYTANVRTLPRRGMPRKMTYPAAEITVFCRGKYRALLIIYFCMRGTVWEVVIYKSTFMKIG